MFANQLAKPLKLETIINSVYKQVRSGEIKKLQFDLISNLTFKEGVEYMKSKLTIEKL